MGDSSRWLQRYSYREWKSGCFLIICALWGAAASRLISSAVFLRDLGVGQYNLPGRKIDFFTHVLYNRGQVGGSVLSGLVNCRSGQAVGMLRLKELCQLSNGCGVFTLTPWVRSGQPVRHGIPQGYHFDHRSAGSLDSCIRDFAKEGTTEGLLIKLCDRVRPVYDLQIDVVYIALGVNILPVHVMHFLAGALWSFEWVGSYFQILRLRESAFMRELAILGIFPEC